MKSNLKIWSCGSFVSAILMASGSLASTLCTATSTFNDHQGVNSSAWLADEESGYCALTPDSLLLKVYEFGLCTGASSPSDKSNCTSLFTSDTGKVVDLAVGVSASLANDISLPEGTYTNAYIVLSNETSLKATLEFDTSRTDFDGGSGKFCYTDGRSIDDDEPSIITCSNSPAGATHSVETISFYGDEHSEFANQIPNYPATVAGTQTTTDLYMIASDGQLSTGFDQDFAIYGDQTLAQPVTISGASSITTLDLGISVTNGISFGFYKDGDFSCNSADGCPGDAYFNGLKFVILAR